MNQTPKGNRLHIGIFGRTNAGKSSLLNLLTKQNVSIVSAQAGTTTDAVEKPMELLPLGPVVFIDTAGLGDVTTLGAERMEATRRVLERTDVALYLCEQGEWNSMDEAAFLEFRQRGIASLIVFTKRDIKEPKVEITSHLKEQGWPFLSTSIHHAGARGELCEALVSVVPQDLLMEPPLVADLVQAGDTVVLVVPVDMEAPKGRLILPQVQVIRELLDCDATTLVVKERELGSALIKLRSPPKLVITDSQAFLKVAADVPQSIPMTSFSILFARAKGNLAAFLEGVARIDELRDGDRILIAEACTHHPHGDDIGRVKIPRWIRQYTGAILEFEHVQGHDFPLDLTRYRLVIQCGACMHNRRAVLSRLARAQACGVPMTNYGLVIAKTLGILERAVKPFEAGSCVL